MNLLIVLFLMCFHRAVSNYKQTLLAHGVALAPVSPSSQALPGLQLQKPLWHSQGISVGVEEGRQLW